MIYRTRKEFGCHLCQVISITPRPDANKSWWVPSGDPRSLQIRETILTTVSSEILHSVRQESNIRLNLYIWRKFGYRGGRTMAFVNKRVRGIHNTADYDRTPWRIRYDRLVRMPINASCLSFIINVVTFHHNGPGKLPLSCPSFSSKSWMLRTAVKVELT